MHLHELVKAWQMSSSLHSFNAPASDQDLQKVENEINTRLPQPLRDLYLFSNGMCLFHGDLNIYPLNSMDGNPALTKALADCREWFQIPPEVLVFGDNGSDEHYGIWTTEIRSDIFKHPIIEIGELFHDPACMTIVSTGMLPFLYGVTAFFSLLSNSDETILDAIGLPPELRVRKNEANNGLFTKLRKWIDPTLPDPDPEPYTKGLDTLQVKKLLGV